MIRFIIALICFLIVLFQYKKNRLLSSVSIFSFCYFLIFVVYPSYANTTFSNEKLINWCALLGSLIYFFGVFIGSKLSIKDKKIVNKRELPSFLTVFILFSFCFLVSLFVVYRIYGATAILNLIKGNITSRELSQTIQNASLFSFSQHTIVPCVLCMWITASTKKEKRISIIALFLYALESFVFSFTRIFMISTVIIIFFYEMRNVSKNKQVILSSIAVISLVMLLIIMNYVRCLGFSYEMKLDTLLNLDVIFECTDFSASYNMLDKLLSFDSPYISMLVYLKPLFVFIPRTIWLTKPESLNVQVMQYVDPIAASNGLSSGISILGEGYAVLGFFGMFLSCFIWGLICSYEDKKYYRRLECNNIKSTSNIYYYIFAVFLIISAQRGDWSVYLSTILYFYFLPIYILSKIKITRRKI